MIDKADKLSAYHIDLKRAMWNRTFLDRMVDTVRALGYNAILTELEDKFAFTRYPDLAHADAWAPAEWREVADSCRAKGVEVIPLWQTLGHAECIVSRDAYGHLREAPELMQHYDPTSVAAREMICHCIDEIIAVIRPARLFHLGGDEVWELGKSERLRCRVAEHGLGQIYLDHLTPILEHVKTHGLQPMLWHDMVMGAPSLLDRLDHDTVLVDWDYQTAEARTQAMRIWGWERDVVLTGQPNPLVTWAKYRDMAGPVFRQRFERFAVDAVTRQNGTFPAMYTTDALAAEKFPVVTASAARCWGDAVGVSNTAHHSANAWLSARKGAQVRGNIVTSWAVRHGHPLLDLPTLTAARHGAQSGAAYDWDKEMATFAQTRHGLQKPDFADIISKACQSLGVLRSCTHTGVPADVRAGRGAADAWLTRLDRDFDGREAACRRLHQLAADFSTAHDALVVCKGTAQANAEELSYWIEGVAHSLLVVEAVCALAEDRSADLEALLAERLPARKAATRALFAATYAPASVEEELALRYHALELLA